MTTLHDSASRAAADAVRRARTRAATRRPWFCGPARSPCGRASAQRCCLWLCDRGVVSPWCPCARPPGGRGARSPATEARGLRRLGHPESQHLPRLRRQARALSAARVPRGARALPPGAGRSSVPRLCRVPPTRDVLRRSLNLEPPDPQSGY